MKPSFQLVETEPKPQLQRNASNENNLKRLPNGQYSLTINLQELKKNISKAQISYYPIEPVMKKNKQSNLYKKYESLIGTDEKENRHQNIITNPTFIVN